MHSALGFGVIVKNKLDISTVSSLPRGAAVNYIYNLGVPVTNNWSDQRIIEVFNALRGEDFIAELDIRVGMVVGL